MAGIVGVVGNEAVAVFRIRVGRRMNCAALIADGYHGRTDGITSLAVVLGAAGVWLGYPLADPIIGLLITVATRMLDGVDPAVVDELQHAAAHLPGITKMLDTKARWLGHGLHADVTIAVDDSLSLAEANKIAALLDHEMRGHLPALAAANIRFGRSGEAASAVVEIHAGHHHAPEPFLFRGKLAKGELQIVDTPNGERMQLTVSEHVQGLQAVVVSKRPSGRADTLPLVPSTRRYTSQDAPAEPHEFDATLQLSAAGQTEELAFHMAEPEGHHH